MVAAPAKIETDEATEAPVESAAWLPRDEAQALLGINRRQMARLIKEGHVSSRPNIFNRRQIVVKRADVERIKRDGVDGMKPPRRRGK